MKKIMFWGDSPAIGTGFGNVIKFIIKHLPKEYTPVVLGMHHNNTKHDLPYRIYSVKFEEEQTNPSKIKEIIKKENPDILFMLQDIWNLDSIISFLSKEKILKSKLKTIGYIPVDAKDHNPAWYHQVDKLDKLVVYNEFGKSIVNKARPDQPVEIIEHGVDTEVFKPLNLPRINLRKMLFPDAPELDNAFVFLNAGRNQPRKLLDISMRAFAKFAQGKSNVYLYMHCGFIDAYMDVLRYAEILGIQDKLLMTSEQPGRVNVPIEHLNAIYNFCDVGLNSGLGEGFGLPNAEHASIGKPQIVPDHSALTDLYLDCGLLVPATIPTIITPYTMTTHAIAVEDMVEKMEILYSDKKLYGSLSKASVKKFTSEKYSWKYITQQWVELFDEL